MLASAFNPRAETYVLGHGSYCVALVAAPDLTRAVIMSNDTGDVPHDSLNDKKVGIVVKTDELTIRVPTALSTDIVQRVTAAAVLKKNGVHDAMLPVTEFGFDDKCASLAMTRGAVTMVDFMRLETHAPLYLVFVFDMVHAVVELWKARLVPTDLKDTNVMLTFDGHWRLVDIIMDADNTLKGEVTTEYACDFTKQVEYHTFGWHEVQLSLALLFATTASKTRINRRGHSAKEFLDTKDDASAFTVFRDTAGPECAALSPAEQLQYRQLLNTLRKGGFDSPVALLAHPFVSKTAASVAVWFRPKCTVDMPSPSVRIKQLKKNEQWCTADAISIDALLVALPIPDTCSRFLIEGITPVVVAIRERMKEKTDVFNGWQCVIVHCVVAAATAVKMNHPAMSRLCVNQLLVLCMWPALAMHTKNVFGVHWMNKTLPFKTKPCQVLCKDIVLLSIQSFVQHRRLIKAALFDPVTFSADFSPTASIVRSIMKAFDFSFAR